MGDRWELLNERWWAGFYSSALLGDCCDCVLHEVTVEVGGGGCGGRVVAGTA